MEGKHEIHAPFYVSKTFSISDDVAQTLIKFKCQLNMNWHLKILQM